MLLAVNTNSSGQGQTPNSERPTLNVEFRSCPFVPVLLLVIELCLRLSLLISHDGHKGHKA